MPDRPPHLLLDQNIPREILPWLRLQRPGWTVSHVCEAGLEGKSDAEVFRWAQSHRAIIVTFDEDFADARSFPLGTHHGVVRLRVWPTTVEMTQAALDRMFSQVPESDLAGSLVIVDREKIRLRRKP